MLYNTFDSLRYLRKNLSSSESYFIWSAYYKTDTLSSLASISIIYDYSMQYGNYTLLTKNTMPGLPQQIYILPTLIAPSALSEKFRCGSLYRKEERRKCASGENYRWG